MHHEMCSKAKPANFPLTVVCSGLWEEAGTMSLLRSDLRSCHSERRATGGGARSWRDAVLCLRLGLSLSLNLSQSLLRNHDKLTQLCSYQHHP